MRRTHLRGNTNILKRLLGGFNLGLLMRSLLGVGTPRGLQGRLAALIAVVITLRTQLVDLWRHHEAPFADHPAAHAASSLRAATSRYVRIGRLTTG